MTRKDYELLANIVRESIDIKKSITKKSIVKSIDINSLVNRICYYLGQDNPKFNEVKFRKDCDLDN